MKIINDIAYADNFEELLEVSAVKPLSNYKLYIEFTNGDARVFDFKLFLDFPVFAPLRDEKIFQSVQVKHGVAVGKQTSPPTGFMRTEFLHDIL